MDRKFVLIVLFLLLALPSKAGTIYSPPPSVVATGVPNDAIDYGSFQRKAVYFCGKHWIFYANGFTGFSPQMMRAGDDLSWSLDSIDTRSGQVTAYYGSKFSVASNGTNLFFAFHGAWSGDELTFASGECLHQFGDTIQWTSSPGYADYASGPLLFGFDRWPPFQIFPNLPMFFCLSDTNIFGNVYTLDTYSYIGGGSAWTCAGWYHNWDTGLAVHAAPAGSVFNVVPLHNTATYGNLPVAITKSGWMTLYTTAIEPSWNRIYLQMKTNGTSDSNHTGRLWVRIWKDKNADLSTPVLVMNWTHSDNIFVPGSDTITLTNMTVFLNESVVPYHDYLYIEYAWEVMAPCTVSCNTHTLYIDAKFGVSSFYSQGSYGQLGIPSIAVDSQNIPWIIFRKTEWNASGTWTGWGSTDTPIGESVVKCLTGARCAWWYFPTLSEYNVGGYEYPAPRSDAYTNKKNFIATLDNGKAYAVYSSDSTSSNMAGRLWDGTNWGPEESIATDSTPYYASGVGYGSDVFVAYLRTDNSLVFAKRSYSSSTWTKTVLNSTLSPTSAPVLSVDPMTGDLYLFWAQYDHIYYKIYTALTQTWDTPHDWIDESANHLLGNDKITSFYAAADRRIGVAYIASPGTLKYDYLFLNFNPAVNITLLSPPGGFVTTNRTINFTYNVTWLDTAPQNCSIVDDVNGQVATNSNLVNSSVNSILYTYSSDYTNLNWTVKCCTVFNCFTANVGAPKLMLSIHTSKINAVASPADSQCFQAPAYFYCNYTDGNGVPIGTASSPAYVNITINGTLYSNSGILNVDCTNGNSNFLPCAVNFDGSMYYELNDSLPLGPYSWNCSAWAATYPYNSTATSSYSIVAPRPSGLKVTMWPLNTTTPPQPYGTKVAFYGNYTNQSSGLTVNDAETRCQLTIGCTLGSSTYQAFLNSTGVYEVDTAILLPCLNPWRFECSRTCLTTNDSYGTYPISYAGVPSLPALVFEDPIYSLNTSATFHKVIAPAPNPENLVRNMGISSAGANWVYGMVVKVDTPLCADLAGLDSSKILLVKNSTNIADTGSCNPGVNSFAGVIFDDNVCGQLGSVICNITKPYAYNFAPRLYDKIPNHSYVLLNGEYNVTQDISGLRDFYSNGYYRASNYAPSFLMRLSGDFEPSTYGIESFVRIDSFMQSKSSVDYYYFSNNNPAVYKIKGMPNCENSTICNDSNKPHFYLDNSIANVNASGVYTHVQLYGGVSIIVTQPGTPPAPGSPCMAPSCSASCKCSDLGYNSNYLCCPGPQGICMQPACISYLDCPSHPGNLPQCWDVSCEGTGCPITAGGGGDSRCTYKLKTNPPVECNIIYGCVPDCVPPNQCINHQCVPKPPHCGNGTCDTSEGETWDTCPEDCCLSCQGIISPTLQLDYICHSKCANIRGCDHFVSQCDAQVSGSKICIGSYIEATCCDAEVDCTFSGGTCIGNSCVNPTQGCDASSPCPPGKHCCNCAGYHPCEKSGITTLCVSNIFSGCPAAACFTCCPMPC